MGCEVSIQDIAMKDNQKGMILTCFPGEVIIKGGSNRQYKFDQGILSCKKIILMNLKRCTVYINDLVDKVDIKNCEDCSFAVGTCMNMLLISECNNCQVTAVCRQCRVANSADCSVFLHTYKRSFIERSKGIIFGCGTYSYKGIIQYMRDANLDVYINDFHEVLDVTPGFCEFKIEDGLKSTIKSLDGSRLLPFFFLPKESLAHTLEFKESSWLELVNRSFSEGFKLTGIRKFGHVIQASYFKSLRKLSFIAVSQS